VVVLERSALGRHKFNFVPPCEGAILRHAYHTYDNEYTPWFNGTELALGSGGRGGTGVVGFGSGTASAFHIDTPRIITIRWKLGGFLSLGTSYGIPGVRALIKIYQCSISELSYQAQLHASKCFRLRELKSHITRLFLMQSACTTISHEFLHKVATVVQSELRSACSKCA
jgi:hypothetical protein